MFGTKFAKFALTAAAAAGLIVAGAGAAGASTAKVTPHATTVCGSTCVDLHNAFLGHHYVQNAKAPGSVGAVGQQIYMRRASDSALNEDFVPSFTGFVNNGPLSACAKGLLPAQSEACLNIEYANDAVWQMQFAPDSNRTHLCIGTTPGVATFASERVRLQNCGSATTLWISDVQFNDGHGDTPWINGADTDFTDGNALVLNVAKAPGYNLNLAQENPNGSGPGAVNDHMQFGVEFGPAV